MIRVYQAPDNNRNEGETDQKTRMSGSEIYEDEKKLGTLSLDADELSLLDSLLAKSAAKSHKWVDKLRGLLYKTKDEEKYGEHFRTANKTWLLKKAVLKKVRYCRTWLVGKKK